MQQLWIWLSGKKTYLIALATVAWGIFGYWDHLFDLPTAAGFVFGAAGMGALRHGVSTTLIDLASAFGPQIIDGVVRALPAPPAPIVAAGPELAAVAAVVKAAVDAGHSPAAIAAVASTALPAAPQVAKAP